MEAGIGLLCASIPCCPSATVEPVGHFLVRGSNRDSRVFAAIASDCRPCWPCGNRVFGRTVDGSYFVDQEQITDGNDDIFCVESLTLVTVLLRANVTRVGIDLDTQAWERKYLEEKEKKIGFKTYCRRKSIRNLRTFSNRQE